MDQMDTSVSKSQPNCRYDIYSNNMWLHKIRAHTTYTIYPENVKYWTNSLTRINTRIHECHYLIIIRIVWAHAIVNNFVVYTYINNI